MQTLFIRNLLICCTVSNGKLLTGNNGHPSSNDKSDEHHTYTYSLSSIASHEDVQLTVPSLILIALLRGGDYDCSGLINCGPNVAYALARCGFGESLLDKFKQCGSDEREMRRWLDGWREDVKQELRTNSRGFLKTKKKALADSIPDNFPDLHILNLYANPIVSSPSSDFSSRSTPSPEFSWCKDPDLASLASLCEAKFEWGTKREIVKRFRDLLWKGVTLRALRRANLEVDEDERARPSTPTRNAQDLPMLPPRSPTKRSVTTQFSVRSGRAGFDSDAGTGGTQVEKRDEERLILAIKGKRKHSSLDGYEEYRLEIDPRTYVRLTESGIRGTRIDKEQWSSAAPFSSQGYAFDPSVNLGGNGSDDSEGGKGKLKKAPPNPDATLRIWMPCVMVERIEPELVNEFEEREEAKRLKKAGKSSRAQPRAAASTTSKPRSRTGEKAGGHDMLAFRARKTNAVATVDPKWKGKGSRLRIAEESETEEEMDAVEDFSDVFGLKPKPSSSSKYLPKPRVRSKPRSKASALLAVAEDDSSTESDSDCEENPTLPQTTLALSSSPPRPSSSQSRFHPHSSTKLPSKRGKAKLPSSSQGQGSTDGGTKVLSKKGSVLDALNASSLPSSSTASASEPYTTRKEVTRPFPMAFQPLARARERTTTPSVSASTSSVIASASTTALPAKAVSKAGTKAKEAPCGSTDKALVVLSDEELPSVIVPKGRGKATEAEKSYIEISSSDTGSESEDSSGDVKMDMAMPSDSRTSSSVNSYQPQAASALRGIVDDTIFAGDRSVIELSSSPAASPARPSQPCIIVPLQQPQMRSQTRVDDIFKASKPKPYPSAKPSVTPFPMIKAGQSGPRSQAVELGGAKKKVRNIYEFREEDIIDLD